MHVEYTVTMSVLPGQEQLPAIPGMPGGPGAPRRPERPGSPVQRNEKRKDEKVSDIRTWTLM